MNEDQTLRQNKLINLKIAQDLAKLLAARYKTITSDDVQRQLAKRNITLGNMAGSIFKPSVNWEWTGEWAQSTRKSAHSRYIRVWRYSAPKDIWTKQAKNFPRVDE